MQNLRFFSSSWLIYCGVSFYFYFGTYLSIPFNDIFSLSDHVAPSDNLITERRVERMWIQAAMQYICIYIFTISALS